MHVPYRNSQLTRLLQTSLSGNAKVAFLCTISPEPECEVETLSTLRFAAGAKKVETRAEMGQVVDRATLLEALESKVLELEAALMTNADYTEALERERDEAIERADGAEKICDDVSALHSFLPFFSFQNLDKKKQSNSPIFISKYFISFFVFLDTTI